MYPFRSRESPVKRRVISPTVEQREEATPAATDHADPNAGQRATATSQVGPGGRGRRRRRRRRRQREQPHVAARLQAGLLQRRTATTAAGPTAATSLSAIAASGHIKSGTVLQMISDL